MRIPKTKWQVVDAAQAEATNTSEFDLAIRNHALAQPDNVIRVHVGDVVRLFERNAPYTPLGGWYRPDADLDEPGARERLGRAARLHSLHRMLGACTATTRIGSSGMGRVDICARMSMVTPGCTITVEVRGSYPSRSKRISARPAEIRCKTKRPC